MHTPETDKKAWRSHRVEVVDASFARQLERSRNDLVKELADLKRPITEPLKLDAFAMMEGIAAVSCEDASRLQAQLSTVTRERDEARAEFNKECITHADTRESLEQTKDQLHSVTAKLESASQQLSEALSRGGGDAGGADGLL